MAEEFCVIGASSFYGSSFIKLVESRGHVVHRMSLRNWSPDEIKGDYVVNFAAANIVAESWEKPAEYMLVNVVALTEILEQLTKKEIKKYVHVSTPEVYGSHHEWLKEEDARFNPSTPYAVSRAAGDMLVMAYHKAYGLPAVITRTANIYGPGQPDNRIITKALKCKKEGKDFSLDGGGNSVRCFISVSDASQAIYLASTVGRPGETYHISGWNPVSIRELIDRIGVKWQTNPERLGKDYCYKLDSTKIRKHLGWMDKISLEEGLKECESAISV